MPSQFEVHRAKDCAIFKFPLGISAEADEIIKVAAIEANTIYFIVSLQLFRPHNTRRLYFANIMNSERSPDERSEIRESIAGLAPHLVTLMRATLLSSSSGAHSRGHLVHA